MTSAPLIESAWSEVIIGHQIKCLNSLNFPQNIMGVGIGMQGYRNSKITALPLAAPW